MRIAVTGGSGFIGARLVETLAAEGVAVALLTRSRARARERFPAARFAGVEIVAWDAARPEAAAGALDGCDGVVHLAGAPIAGRWTPGFKQAIRESREAGTRALVDAMAAAGAPPPVLVSSSACRAYGVSETATFDEDSPPPPPGDFLADVCKVWEAEARRAEGFGARVVVLRHGFALAMTPSFAEALRKFRRFVGGPVGSGRQWISWIHRDDTVALIRAALADPAYVGPVNAVAPNPVRMADFTAELGRRVGGRLPVPAPGFVLEALFGDGATVILDGQNVRPTRATAAGFRFRYPDLPGALAAIL